MLNAGVAGMCTGHLQRNSTVDLVPTKQHSASPKWDTGPTTTPEQHPTKSQPMLLRPPGIRCGSQPSPAQNGDCGLQGPMHEFVHFERNCGSRGCSRHRGGSWPILHAPPDPLPPQSLISSLLAALLTPADSMEQLGPVPAADVRGAGAISGYERRLLPNHPSGAGGDGEALKGDRGQQSLLAPADGIGSE
ncbi:hypothetical protein MDA_GLEAN10003639 [Myotis davidii]|uniref:Uncharacterized protein n=1 Tax=Myotis davidii TaxID=225400 RepID=L5LTI9_MYODS|nr:hypothetical protein MDA_GLEAN10003639 [Myotis davidii]